MKMRIEKLLPEEEKSEIMQEVEEIKREILEEGLITESCECRRDAEENAITFMDKFSEKVWKRFKTSVEYHTYTFDRNLIIGHCTCWYMVDDSLKFCLTSTYLGNHDCSGRIIIKLSVFEGINKVYEGKGEIGTWELIAFDEWLTFVDEIEFFSCDWDTGFED